MLEIWKLEGEGVLEREGAERAVLEKGEQERKELEGMLEKGELDMEEELNDDNKLADIHPILKGKKQSAVTVSSRMSNQSLIAHL